MKITRDSNRPRLMGPGILALLAAIVAGSSGDARADVKLPSIFGSHMVLQRDQKDRVWGWAEPGEEVTVEVDAEYRRSLSIGHTGCHLVSLALNRALGDRWTKDAAADALGAPDFDKLAIDSSTIVPFGSVDTFRLNKSLRRKGFVTDGLADALPTIAAAVNSTLEAWLATHAAVSIRREGDALTDRRYWECTLPDGEASIACGGQARMCAGSSVNGPIASARMSRVSLGCAVAESA